MFPIVAKDYPMAVNYSNKENLDRIVGYFKAKGMHKLECINTMRDILDP